ncbi:hypothetical protein DYB37_008386 [Aphanomyces astaci]|uniref:Peptidase A2 domain-containing protein n=1 Tax=Aphanomyces astaci TaxID=112090 RepID=A0A3R7CDZ6_APHAT|nr:hypothetical protein DYB37_008386 [Aphanomyces astaci]
MDTGQSDVHLHNDPALPKNPTFKGPTKEERHVFMDAYNLYISQTNALTVIGIRPFIMPQGYDVDPRALDTLKKRIKSAVVFDMSIPDADSWIGRMLDGLVAAIRRDRQEWVIREENQAIVKIITDAIKPASLHPTRETRSTEDTRVEDHGMTQGPEGKREAPATCSERTDQRLTECKSISHQIRECPGITPEVVKQLLRAHGSTFERGRSGEKEAPGAPGGRVAMEETDVPDAKRPELPTIVVGVLPAQASLLDSGADLLMASGGLFSALLAAGAPREYAPVELTLGLPVMQKLGYNE